MQLGFAVLAAIGTVHACGAADEGRVMRGQLPPDFTGTTLDGRRITLSEFRGKNPVVLNFYAQFCGPCREEFPHLRELDERLGSRGLKVLAVSMDEDRKSAAAIPREARAHFPVIFDPGGSIARKYGVQAIPHTVVLDREGRVSTILIGLDNERLDRAVSTVLK